MVENILIAAPLTRRRVSIGALGLAIIPSIIVLLPALERNRIGPYYLVSKVDPSYAYLLNSLMISCGNNPRHIDHPGTTLQIFGSLVIGLMNILGRKRPICPIHDVLTSPEFYLSGISLALQIAVAAVSIATAVRVYRLTGNIIAALVLEVGILTSETVIHALLPVATEALVITVALALGFCLLPLLTGARPESSRDPLVVGGIVGFGLATKLTMAPLVLFVLLFRGSKSKIKFVGACAGSFIFWTLPISNMYRKLATWITNLAVHAGHYGEGPVGTPPLAEMVRSAMDLIVANEAAFLIFVVGAALALWSRSRQAKMDFSGRFLLLSLCVFIVQLLMTAKHPAPHYMMPAVVLAAIASSIVAEKCESIWRGLSVAYLGAVVLIGITPFIANFRYFANDLPEGDASEQRSSARILDVAATKCNVLIPTDRTSSIENGLRFGNNFADGKFDPALGTLYPKFIYYVNNRFMGFGKVHGDAVPGTTGTGPTCVYGMGELPDADTGRFRLLETEGQYHLYEMVP